MPDDVPGLLGYSGLTPEQMAQVQQYGYFPQPTMSLPTGQTLQQPQGYSGLTPAQAMTVNQLGYYNGTPGTGQQSLWDQITGKLGSPAMGDLTKAIQGMGTPQPRPNLAPQVPFTGMSYPSFNPYRPAHYYRSPLDPKQALAALQRGY